MRLINKCHLPWPRVIYSPPDHLLKSAVGDCLPVGSDERDALAHTVHDDGQFVVVVDGVQALHGPVRLRLLTGPVYVQHAHGSCREWKNTG